MRTGNPKLWSGCMVAVVAASIAASLWNRSTITEPGEDSFALPPPSADPPAPFDSIASLLLQGDPGGPGGNGSRLEYDFYRNTCPDAEAIVRRSMARIHSEHPEVSPALLRLLFHDCFIEGCDASIFLDDSYGNQSRHIEKQAVPNQTLKGFEQIDMIKEEVENRCPGIVSCADILVLATREGIVLAGGPFYPLFTGRRDSISSYYDEALHQIPTPNDQIKTILYLFHVRGFSDREIVSLLGAHSIGRIGCQFIQNRLHPHAEDPTIAPDFLAELRQICSNRNNRTGSGNIPPMLMRPREVVNSSSGFTNEGDLSASIPSVGGFTSHYYRALLRGRGLLHSDQQLMADERTARVVKAYASDDGITFRMDFARAMMKMSSLGVLTGAEGQVRENCSSFARNFFRH